MGVANKEQKWRLMVNKEIKKFNKEFQLFMMADK
jgi:hypothetical protein